MFSSQSSVIFTTFTHLQAKSHKTLLVLYIINEMQPKSLAKSHFHFTLPCNYNSATTAQTADTEGDINNNRCKALQDSLFNHITSPTVQKHRITSTYGDCHIHPRSQNGV